MASSNASRPDHLVLADLQATLELGANLARLWLDLPPEARPILLLEGDLGAGKTFFVSELFRAMGSLVPAVSPTFPVVNTLQLRSVYNGVDKICHLDLYRLKSSDEMLQLGLELEVTNQSLVLLEWPENIDSEGWEKFFKWTRCKKPKRAISVHIDRAEAPEERNYRLRLLNSFEWWRESN